MKKLVVLGILRDSSSTEYYILRPSPKSLLWGEQKVLRWAVVPREPTRFEIVRKDGKELYLEIHPHPRYLVVSGSFSVEYLQENEKEILVDEN